MQICRRGSNRRSTAVIARAGARRARRGSPRRCATRSFPAVPASARGCALRSRIACGDDDPQVADAAAAAIELLHCASLVHDDLPCFDDADTAARQAVGARRLRRAAGGAGRRRADRARLRDAGARPRRAPRAAGAVARGSSRRPSARRAASSPGRPGSAKRRPLADYQRAKTGSLFVAATRGRRRAAGADAEPWRTLGDRLGEAYQVADDIRDVLCDARGTRQADRPGRRRLRPNAVAQLGVGGAGRGSRSWSRAASKSIPDCPGAAELRALIKAQTALSSQTARPRSGLSGQPMSAACILRLGGSRGLARALAQLAQRPRRRSAIPALGGRFPAHAADRAAPREGAVRSLRRLRLFADPARLRAAAPVRDCWPSGPQDVSDIAVATGSLARGRAAPAARRGVAAARARAPNDRFALGDLGAAMLGNPGRRLGRASHAALRRSARSGRAAARRSADAALGASGPMPATPGD